MAPQDFARVLVKGNGILGVGGLSSNGESSEKNSAEVRIRRLLAPGSSECGVFGEGNSNSY